MANYISLATALGSSFTDQEYKARESIWLGRKKRVVRGGSFGDHRPYAISIQYSCRPGRCLSTSMPGQSLRKLCYRTPSCTCLADHAAAGLLPQCLEWSSLNSNSHPAEKSTVSVEAAARAHIILSPERHAVGVPYRLSYEVSRWLSSGHKVRDANLRVAPLQVRNQA